MNSFFPAVDPFSSASAANVIDPYRIATGQQKVDPELFKRYLAASMTSIDSLFGGDSSSERDGFWGANMFPSGQSAGLFPSTGSVYEQMIAQSNLIGKNVEAYDPVKKQNFSGRVTGVAVEGGGLYITVGEMKIPPEYLLSIKE